MTKNKLLLVSVLSSLGVASVAAAHPGAAEHFKKLDGDGDGTVTTTELEQGALARWTTSDANRDGKVTAEELEAGFAAHKQDMFTKKDANGDGQLSKDELGRLPEARFTAMDTDKSGSLSQAELAAAHPGAKRGKAIFGKGKGLPGDADGDGAITKAEALAGAQQMAKKLDADGDGKLSQQELTRGHAAHAGRATHGVRGHAPGAKTPPATGAGDAG
jgi:Ca2+-binding EF-hand superfamily protein